MHGLFCCALVGLVVAAGAAVGCDDADWEPLQRMLEDGVAQRVFPGATAAVFDGEHIIWEGAAGNYTYGEYPPMNPGVVPPVTLDVCSLSLVHFCFLSNHQCNCRNNNNRRSLTLQVQQRLLLQHLPLLCCTNGATSNLVCISKSLSMLCSLFFHLHHHPTPPPPQHR